MSRLLMTLILSSGLALGATGCDKTKVLAKTSLDATKPLTISFEDDLEPCATHLCFVAIAADEKEVGKSVKLAEGSRLVRVMGDGTWTAFEMGDVPEAEEDEELPEDWKDKPIKAYDERKAEATEKAMGNATKEVASGTLTEVDGKRILEIAPDLLPAGEFVVYTNGWFGAALDGERIGTPTKMGLVEIAR
jgi:hypothetical protein